MWITFESDNDSNRRERVGLPNSIAFHDMGLSTIIGSQNKDSTGHPLNTHVNSSIQRLRTWDARSRSNISGHRNLMQAFSELSRLKDKLGLTNTIVEKAAYIYRKAEEKQMIRGRSMSAILAAAIYIACRELGAPKSFREMTESSQVKSKAIRHCYRLLAIELDAKTPLIEPSKYIARIANKAGISEKTKRLALTMMKEITKNEISAGKNPVALAATVLYLSCLARNENQTQMKIAAAAGTTEVSIRNRSKDLKTKYCLNTMIWEMPF
ncbi:MAG: transcription initiation factor IIB [Thermoproteota archaeon]|nr:transcription initiation factor IIB [Thermoproteota archaeon]